MKPIVIIGIIIIVLGIVALAYQGISYVTHDKVIDMGPIQVSADRTHTIPIAPILGAVAIIAGVILLAMGIRTGH
jgi:drug/metabolite transporter (DMT)-like permease